ncbi:SlyX family protein [Allorhodopirellula heiligendammensis]|uniref:Protein SlyX n=1 Tax=Allorhodopirellula heiligendammensis TaxID=2714739 RepID=A0A5C6BYN1_9BACT|nr:SlyX family protein [Allorhodopirellula heiligendammensis]TWU15729.1 hypothetical protein Poly21_29310 [Allorhodopirellula heiligendammensis]
MPDSIEQRLTDLEIQLAHMQRTCEQLNEVVTHLSVSAQSRERLMQRMVDQIKDLKANLRDPGSPSDEKPPHY